MTKEELFAYIWREKREKIISNKVYPIGISITIENLSFCWHTIIYGILSLLMRNPAQSLEWSRHWGRTTVWVHPQKALSFRFTQDESLEEKLGVFISTENTINPILFLNDHYNIGYFRILLNWCNVSLEGAILQIERMVDELVWCNFLKHKRQNQKCEFKSLNEIEIYTNALSEVWENGVFIEYLLESKILDMKIKNMTLPIRIYGNILKTGNVPNIIGAVIIPQSDMIDKKHECQKIINGQKKEIISVIGKSQVQSKVYSTNSIMDFNENRICVCVAITLAKKLHVGHLLLLGFADLIRRSTNSKYPLYLESNDSGKRIFGLVARIVEKYNISVELAISLLIDGRYSPQEIDSCYKDRQEQGNIYQQIQTRLKHNEIGLLSVMEEKVQQDMEYYGFGRINIISDSKCLSEYNKIVASIACQWENNIGFKFVKYIEGRHKKMVVIEKQGVPMASAMRVAFINKILSDNRNSQSSILPVFVDVDASVVHASDLFKLMHKRNLIQLEGVAVGFEMKIASGTSGNIMQTGYLYESFCKKFSKNNYPNLFLSVITFFLLTRYATAKAHKKHELSKGHPLEPSFYDYKNNQALLDDFLLCTEELLAYSKLLRNIQKNICFRIDEQSSDIQFKDGEVDKKRIKGLLIRLEKIDKEKKIFHQLFPTPRSESLARALRKIREKIHQKCCNLDHQLIDRIIVEALVYGYDTVEKLNNILLSKGIIQRPLIGNKNQKLVCIFIDNLRLRGYCTDIDELVKFSLAYLKGDFCLLKKKCIYFEALQDIIICIDNISSFDSNNAEIIQKAITICIKRLGF